MSALGPAAEVGAMSGHVARPRTLAERLSWLVADANRILARPSGHSAEAVRWAGDMIAAQNR
jgi:hypothetical protein